MFKLKRVGKRKAACSGGKIIIFLNVVICFVLLAIGIINVNAATDSYYAGYGSSTNGDYSVAVGNYSSGNMNYSTALGYYGSALGKYSTAIGANSDAIGTFSTALTLVSGANIITTIASDNAANKTTEILAEIGRILMGRVEIKKQKKTLPLLNPIMSRFMKRKAS